jgi:hypothetical protein
LQKRKNKFTPQIALSVKLFKARTPCAKNGCGIIVGYCYAPEISGCYCLISFNKKVEPCSQLAGFTSARHR